jgi:hypothetical protein
MVLGDDIGLKDCVTLSLCALVGRLSYKHLFCSNLIPWVLTTWRPLLGYEPEITHLTVWLALFQIQLSGGHYYHSRSAFGLWMEAVLCSRCW